MSSPNQYLIGNVVRMSATFTVAGTATDPTGTPVCTVRGPAGSATPSVTKSATGVFTATYQPGAAGRYRFRWVGTGTAAAAGEGQFYVKPSAL